MPRWLQLSEVNRLRSFSTSRLSWENFSAFDGGRREREKCGEREKGNDMQPGNEQGILTCTIAYLHALFYFTTAHSCHLWASREQSAGCSVVGVNSTSLSCITFHYCAPWWCHSSCQLFNTLLQLADTHMQRKQKCQVCFMVIIAFQDSGWWTM